MCLFLSTLFDIKSNTEINKCVSGEQKNIGICGGMNEFLLCRGKHPCQRAQTQAHEKFVKQTTSGSAE